MKKIILDFNRTGTKDEVQEYLQEMLEFPARYGKNLDALYDELTSLAGPVAVGFFMPTPELEEMDLDLMMYLCSVRDVFLEAEKANPGLGVIMGELNDNFPEETGEDDGMSLRWQY